MNFVEVLKACESAGGGGSKQVIKDALATLDADGCKLLKYTMDPYTVFGVKKFDMPATFSAQDPTDISPLFRLLDDLASRNLTGNAARGSVTTALSNFTKETAAYLTRVIAKDPRAGFSADTFNLVYLAKAMGIEPDVLKKRIAKEGLDFVRSLPAYAELIPTWEQQLADKCESEEDFEAYVTFPCQGDIKYDGNRQFAFVKEGQPVDYRARGGKESEHLNGVFDADLQLIRKVYGRDFVLDGETMAASFTETQNAKKSGADKSALIFRAFFIMPLEDWVAQKTTITNEETRKTLTELLAAIESETPSRKIRLTEGKIVQDYKAMTKYCNEVIDDETKTTAEREGLILKKLDAVYEWGRSFAWVKVKRFYDVDARFVSFYPGRKGSKYENTIGGANCVAFLESGERVEFNVGSGFNDKDRESMLNEPEKWLAATHVIKYQEISKAKGKELRSLRFCTYERSRDDKMVEV